MFRSCIVGTGAGGTVSSTDAPCLFVLIFSLLGDTGDGVTMEGCSAFKGGTLVFSTLNKEFNMGY